MITPPKKDELIEKRCEVCGELVSTDIVVIARCLKCCLLSADEIKDKKQDHKKSKLVATPKDKSKNLIVATSKPDYVYPIVPGRGSFVYILHNQAWGDEIYKVGISTAWKSRLSQFQIGDPFRSYEMPFTFFSHYALTIERRIHKEYPKTHEAGEWIHGKLDDIIESIKSHDEKAKTEGKVKLKDMKTTHT